MSEEREMTGQKWGNLTKEEIKSAKFWGTIDSIFEVLHVLFYLCGALIFLGMLVYVGYVSIYGERGYINDPENFFVSTATLFVYFGLAYLVWRSQRKSELRDREQMEREWQEEERKEREKRDALNG